MVCEQGMFNAFKGKVLRKIYGLEWVNGQWRNRHNHEMCKLYEEIELTRNIRLKSPVCGSCDDAEGRKGAQESAERINRSEKTSWKA